MKYTNFHLEKPEINKLIYWFGPDGKDHLGWYRGPAVGYLLLEEVERAYPGYVPKWWYYAEEELTLSIEDPRFPREKIPLKRGRPSKKVEEPVDLPPSKDDPKLEAIQKEKPKVEFKTIKVRKPGEKPENTDDFF